MLTDAVAALEASVRTSVSANHLQTVEAHVGGEF